MDRDRIELSALDPERGGAVWRRRVARIMDAAAPILERRARHYGPVRMVAEWIRPALATAAVLVLFAMATLTLVERRPRPAAMTAGVPEALQLPAPAMQWLAEGRAPSVADLVSEVEGGP